MPIAAKYSGLTHRADVGLPSGSARPRLRELLIGKRRVVYYSSSLDARYCFHAFQNLAIVGDLVRCGVVLTSWSRVRKRPNGNAQCEHMIGTEAVVFLLQPDKAADHEARSDQQQESESRFQGDEYREEPPRTSEPTAPGSAA